jgi:hypothetical protein
MGSVARGGPVALIAAAGVVSAAAGGLRIYKLRSSLASMSLLKQTSTIITVAFVLANIKNLPFVWHVSPRWIYHICPLSIGETHR